MASNDQWPPVASTGKGAVKTNGSKRNIKDLQQKVLKQVNEMFGSALEPEIILSVVQNCNWELQPSIEGLITLTETVDEPLVWDNKETKNETMTPLASLTVQHPLGLKGGSSEDSKSEFVAQEAPPVESLGSEPPTPPKSEKPKKIVAKNRMGAFCGNIAKLKSSVENSGISSIQQLTKKTEDKQEIVVKPKSENSFDDILNYGASGVQNITEISPKKPSYIDYPGLPQGTKTAGNFPPAGFRPSENVCQSKSSKLSTSPKQQPNKAQQFWDTKAAAEDFEFNKNPNSVDSEINMCTKKLETESRLCGLKVQYRMSGMESSSDDDADVVIENESSDYEINIEPSISINVSQFLSPPTQTAPRRTQPEFNMISTPSPPRTPQRNAHEITLERIKSSIEKGYKIMILLRGLPGSGKTTLAKNIVATTIGGNPSAYVFNTDDFFVTLGRGIYQFDPTRLQDAHSTNQKRVWTALNEGRSPVIVDNTNTEAWEMKPYASMAVEGGYIVEIIEPNTKWAKNINELAKKNTHNVPKIKIREKSQRYELITNATNLLNKYHLKYSELNKPPQIRYIPPYIPSQIPPIRTYVRTLVGTPKLNNTEEYWNDEDKNSYILSSHDIESMQNIDETHSASGGLSERASVATDSSESSSNPEKAANFKNESFNNYLQELPDSDDESFEMLEGSGSDNLSDINGTSADSTVTDSSNQSHVRLLTEESNDESVGDIKDTSSMASIQIFGAIGSERKGSVSVGSGNIVDNDKTEKKDSSPHGSQQTLGAIGCERKGSLSVSSSIGNLDNDKTEVINFSPNSSNRQTNETAIAGTSVECVEKDTIEIKNNYTPPPIFGLSKITEKFAEKMKDYNVVEPKTESIKYKFPLSHIEMERIMLEARAEHWESLTPEAKRNGKILNAVICRFQKAFNERFSRQLESIETAKESENEDDSVKITNKKILKKKKKGKKKGKKKEKKIPKIIKKKINNVKPVLDYKDIPEYLQPQECSDDTSDDDSLSVEEIKENVVTEACELDIKADNDDNLLIEEIINSEETEGEETSSETEPLELCDASSTENNVESVEYQSNDLLIGNIDAVNEDTEAKAEEVTKEKAKEVTETKIEEVMELIAEEVTKVIAEEVTEVIVEEVTEVKAEDVTEVKADEATEVKADEITEKMPKVGTFGTFLNMLKSSILGGAEDPSSSDVKDENLNEPVSSTYETIPNLSLTIENNTVSIDVQPTTDTVDSPSVVEKSSDEDSLVEIVQNIVSLVEEKSNDKDDKVYGDLSTNPFREEMIKSHDKDSLNDDVKLINDNINSISWRESPFPIDVAKIPLLPLINIEKKMVLKTDASTNTTNYDFNVAYVGGTSEPGYREISAVNRSINEGHSVAKLEDPPLKLMLDKSSTTRNDNILSMEQNSNDEKEKDSTDRIHELVELFPNIPIDHLMAFYNDQCKGDFAWTVEMLLEGVPTDFTIKDLSDKRSIADIEDTNLTYMDSDKKEIIEIGKLKQRSHSSSPRYRRQRSKDYRNFCLDNIDYGNLSSGEPTVDEKDMTNLIKDDEEINYDSFYDQAASKLTVKISDIIPEASSSSTASGLTEDDVEDVIELDFGREFVNQLEETMGNTNFIFPDEFKPTIRIKKSMAEELHALWIQSMYDQLNERHAKLDEMIAKDEEIARALAREETEQPASEPIVPNLEEIMDMEIALARYQNELKEKITKETPNDIASRLSRSLLNELFPDLHPDILSEILKAHGGNFKETCETIETSTGRTINNTDTLKKQQNLLDFVKEENKNREIQENSEDNYAPLIRVKPYTNAIIRDDKWSYKSALARGQDARDEAQKQLSLRMQNLNKAAEAYRKGQPGVAAYYSEMAKLHSDHSVVAHEEAADAFVSAQVYCSDNTLDLHYLFVPEALKALDLFLEVQYEKLAKSGKKKVTLFIITGRGARSNHGQSKIKPAVSKSLNSKNIRFTEANAGCLEVTLSKKNGILK